MSVGAMPGAESTTIFAEARRSKSCEDLFNHRNSIKEEDCEEDDMEMMGREASLKEPSMDSPIPSLFHADRKNLQFVCLVCLGISLSSNVSLFDRLSAAFVLPDLDPEWPLPGTESPGHSNVAVAIAVIFLLASCREAVRFPRLEANRRFSDAFRSILQFVGDLLLTPIFALAPKEKVLVQFQPTKQNEEMLAACPSLCHFKQTPWAHNPYLCFTVLMVLDMMWVNYWRKCVRREELETADGGIVAMDWWEEDKHALKKANKVLLIGSTFTGDSLPWCTREMCRHFSKKGYRCVTMVKRGCGLAYPNVQPVMRDPARARAAPWDLLGLGDITLAIDHVAKTFPDCPIVAVGLSTGAGQLRNYLNKVGEEPKISAAVLIDASNDWKEAILSFDDRQPILSKILATVAKATCARCGPIADVPPPNFAGYEDYARRWGSIMEFIRTVQAPGHGYDATVDGALAYLDVSGRSPNTSAVPVLEMVTYNDCLVHPGTVQNVVDSYKECSNVVTAVTKQGSHMIRWEGWQPRDWLSVSSAEFLGAALNRSVSQGEAGKLASQRC